MVRRVLEIIVRVDGEGPTRAAAPIPPQQALSVRLALRGALESVDADHNTDFLVSVESIAPKAPKARR